MFITTRKFTLKLLYNIYYGFCLLCSPAEYVVYKLKEMGLVNDQLIMSVMEGFKTLDVDNSGTLTSNDLSSLSKIMSRR